MIICHTPDSKAKVTIHIKNIFSGKELDKLSVGKDYLPTAAVQKTIRDIFRTRPQPNNSDLGQEKAARAYSFVYDNLAG